MKNLARMKTTGLVFVSALLLAACGTTRNGTSWGSDATLAPSWERLKTAAINAVSAPETWVPLGGALVMHVSGKDEDISDWASRHNPVFGSTEKADRYSDYFLAASRWTYYLSFLLTPGGNEADVWLGSKIKGAGVGFAATYLNEAIVDHMKDESDRWRPDHSNNWSFPSGHVSKTAVHNAMSLRNIENSNYYNWSRDALHAGFASLTAATAWARIEAKKHYPTDVLVGAAIGNFLGTFINDAFIGLDHTHDLNINISRNAYDRAIQFSILFHF